MNEHAEEAKKFVILDLKKQILINLIEDYNESVNIKNENVMIEEKKSHKTMSIEKDLDKIQES